MLLSVFACIVDCLHMTTAFEVAVMDILNISYVMGRGYIEKAQ